MVLRPALGPPRSVGLCESCRRGRPARDSPELGPADLLWHVLTRDAEALHGDYKRGQWLPRAAELQFAAGLARTQWSEDSMRAVQRTAPYGRLSQLLDNLVRVLRYTDGRDPALLPLHRLVDVLAHHAEGGDIEPPLGR
ncbi:hypothetical protein [Streptomyces sp. NBC_01304]|uniref:hypothetical protein n=1 Tax=Streptomyces sp. NBC_01304 TaxID=2903818 RepID=UPI002E0EDFBE|nr:hypothetical protein OG430_49050 [Streptomyces sp. NBC_01304]